MKTETIHKAETAKHTPGPWEYIGTMNGEGLIIFSQGIHFDKTTAINGGLGYVATVHTRDVGLDIQNTPSEANARLIAAAPDLLRALELVYHDLGHISPIVFDDEIPEHTKDAITAAIAKAKGSA